MGEAKIRQCSTAALLSINKHCVYCGKTATTIDHCPPRCFFIGRAWPETYAYPACHACNETARLDEQAMALMVRVKALQPTYSAQAIDEFSRLCDGVRNNQPALVAEWLSGSSPTKRKRSFRQSFGREQGDLMRLSGWGIMHLGPLTEALIQRFMVRLGQSMFYNRVGELFRGTMYTRHVSLLELDDAEAYLSAALQIAPLTASVRRSGQTLNNQFAYRFNVSLEHRTLYALVHFNEQFVFQITAMGPAMAARFAGGDWPPEAIGQRTEIQLVS